MLRRHGGDAHVELGARDAQARRAVLRQPPLGDVEAGQDLDAGDHGLRRNAARRRHGRSRPSIRIRTDQRGADRLDMNVAGAQFHRHLEKIVDGPDDRRAARQVAQVVDIVVLRRCELPVLSTAGLCSSPRR